MVGPLLPRFRGPRPATKVGGFKRICALSKKSLKEGVERWLQEAEEEEVPELQLVG